MSRLLVPRRDFGYGVDNLWDPSIVSGANGTTILPGEWSAITLAVNNWFATVEPGSIMHPISRRQFRCEFSDVFSGSATTVQCLTRINSQGGSSDRLEFEFNVPANTLTSFTGELDLRTDYDRIIWRIKEAASSFQGKCILTEQPYNP